MFKSLYWPKLNLLLKELYVIEGISFYNGIVFHGRINHNELPIKELILILSRNQFLRNYTFFIEKRFIMGLSYKEGITLT